MGGNGRPALFSHLACKTLMEVVTAKATRRSTRLRVEIPVSVISLDRSRPFGERCTLVVVSAQGCGFQTSEALHLETPIMMSDLPGGGSVTARVVSCVPLGNESEKFLIGAALYTAGNVWGIADPPADWNVAAKEAVVAPGESAASAGQLKVKKSQWPYNMFSERGEAHPGKR
jgi:hypothetical protein